MRVIKYMVAVLLTLTAVASICEGAPASVSQARPTNAAKFLTDIFSHHWGYRRQVDLNGIWEFRRDPNNLGKEQGWYEGKEKFADTMTIPGAPQAQGFGEPTERQKTFFPGPFWVRRTFTLPKLKAGKRVWLRIGGILPAAEVYLNGTYIGYTKSSRTQQRVDVTDFVKSVAENLIAVKVCDFPKVRLDGIWEMGECAKVWTGVYRPIRLEITDRVSVLDLYAQPDLSTGAVGVTVELPEASSGGLTVVLEVKDGQQTIGQKTITLTGNRKAQTQVKLKEFRTWSPAHPKLYTLDISVFKNRRNRPLDKVGIRFGMREISVKGTKFYLNGKPVFMRFFGENQYYPQTLCPHADKDWYLTRLKRAREYGMNGAKGCVEILPQEFVEAADEAGIMIIQETPFGLHGLRANRYTIERDFMDYYSKELDGLVRQSRNHASIVAYSMSSEMEFSNQTQQSFDFFSKQLPRQTKDLAPHALVIDCTGYLNSEDTEKGKRVTDFYASVHPEWMKEALNEADFETDNLYPTILHEYNWWSCYPDPADKKKFEGMQLKPYWLDKLVKTATENGQLELIDTYRKNSLWLQALCRKDGIEYTRRHGIVEGYILWLLIDYQWASEGLLDDFWQPKNVSAEEFIKSNGDTVIVLAKDGNRCLNMKDKVQIRLAVDHYGEQVLGNCTLKWQAKIANTCQQGQFNIPKLKQGELTQAGSAELTLPASERAYKFEMEVALYHNGKLINTNNWSFWAFPEIRESLRNTTSTENTGKIVDEDVFLRLKSAKSQAIPTNASLVIADSVDQALADYIEGGGKCLLFSRNAVIENTVYYYNNITFYRLFRTVPWNAGTSGNSGTVISHHPALEAFPHEGMCDLQFIIMIKGILPMEFSPLRKYGVAPIIRAIDHYIANRNNAYMLEFNVGKGKVFVTSLSVLEKISEPIKIEWGPEKKELDFVENEHIEARYLLQCLVDYAKGARFEPAASVPKAEFVKQFSSREKAGPEAPKELLK